MLLMAVTYLVADNGKKLSVLISSVRSHDSRSRQRASLSRYTHSVDDVQAKQEAMELQPGHGAYRARTPVRH